MELTRLRIAAILGALIFCVVGIAIVASGYFKAERSLDRSWIGFLDAVQNLSQSKTSAFLAETYSDNWGYTRETMSTDLGRVFRAFEELEITPSEITIEHTESGALITAKIHVAIKSRGFGADAQRQVNALTEPFRFQWQRDESFPWSWRIVRIEQPQFDVKRYGPRRASSWF